MTLRRVRKCATRCGVQVLTVRDDRDIWFDSCAATVGNLEIRDTQRQVRSRARA
jgi:hypothetical protein